MSELAVNQDRCTALGNMLALAPQRHNQQTYLAAKPKNECGTVGCVAGWSSLWKRGIISIELNGTMTWPEGAPSLLNGSTDFFAPEPEGREWLGLNLTAATALFIRTAGWYRAEELAVEVLRRLGDGRFTNDTLTRKSVDNLARELRHSPRHDLREYA